MKKETLAQQTAREALERDQQKVLSKVHPYDNFEEWIGQRWEKAPWTEAEILDFQRKINSAFGAENALILAWSGDERYWDQFYEDWHPNGLPKGKLKAKPILLWADIQVNEYDNFVIFPPRFMILERLDRSEYAASWEESSFMEVEGVKRRIRAETPPPSMYKVLKVIAEHDETYIVGEKPHCCKVWLHEAQKICYGRYRPPAEKDLAYIRGIRENMDKLGVSQRADAPREEKVLMHAAQSTQHYMKSAAVARTRAVSEMIGSDPYPYLVDVIKNKGITLTQREIDECVQIGLEQAREQRLKEANI